MIIENVKHMKLNRKIFSVVLNTQILRMIWQNTTDYVEAGTTKKSLMKILSNDLLIFDINKFILMLQKVFMKIYIDFAKVVETRFDPLNY